MPTTTSHKTPMIANKTPEVMPSSSTSGEAALTYSPGITTALEQISQLKAEAMSLLDEAQALRDKANRLGFDVLSVERFLMSTVEVDPKPVVVSERRRRTIADHTEMLMKSQGRDMHVTEIKLELIAKGLLGPKDHNSLYVALARASDRFVRVRHGVYRLKSAVVAPTSSSV